MKIGTVKTSYTRSVFGMRTLFQLLEDKVIGGKLFKTIQVDFADSNQDIKYYPASKFTDLRSYGDWYEGLSRSNTIESAHEDLLLIESLGLERFTAFNRTLNTLQEAYYDVDPCEVSTIMLRRVYQNIRP